MTHLKDAFKLSAPAVLIASLCCIAPIAVVLFGLGSVSFAIALTDVLDRQYQWAFILAGIISLAISLVVYFRRHGICTIDQAKKHRTEIVNKVVIVLSASVVAYIIFLYGILEYIGRIQGLWE